MGAVLAALPYVASAVGIIGAGASAYGAIKSSRTRLPRPSQPPEPPPELTRPSGRDPQRRRFGRQETILTGPLVSDETTYRPTLLGQ